MDEVEAAGVAGLIIYILLLIASVIVLFLFLRVDTHRWQLSIQKIFFATTISFIIFRIIWWSLTFSEDADAAQSDFVVNRIALNLWFTSFSIIVAFWAESIHNNFMRSSYNNITIPVLKWALIAVNVVLYLFQVIVVIVFLALVEDAAVREGHPLYEASVLVNAFCSLILAITFLLYGIRKYQLVRNSGDESIENSNELLKVSSIERNFIQFFTDCVTQIAMVTITCTACFICRVVMFLYRPASGKYISYAVYATLGYILPEVIPTMLQLYIVYTVRQKQTFDAQYIANLYNDNDDDDDDDYEQD